MTTQIVASGVVSFGVTVASGDSLVVSSGGLAFDTTVLNGGRAEVLAGGELEDVVVDGALVGAGKIEGLNSAFGIVSGVNVISGSLSVFAGGHTTNVSAGAGGSLLITGFASGDVVNRGGLLVIETQGVGHGDVVNSGGVEKLLGKASGDVISSGGELILVREITSGQHITATGSAAGVKVVDGETLMAGAILLVSGGVDSGATLSLAADAPLATVGVSAGGLLVGPGGVDGLDDWGVVRGVAVEHGTAFIENGGTISGAVISSGGELILNSHAVGSGDVVRQGGIEWLIGGTALDETIASGGTLKLTTDLVSGQVVTATGSAAETMQFGGVTLLEGAALELVGATVERGAVLHVAPGAKAVIATVNAGGLLTGPGRITSVADFGRVSGVSVAASGMLVIGSGGVASGDRISGAEVVGWRGSARGELVVSGGRLTISSGGVGGGNVISGGSELIASGGRAAGDVLSAGGLLMVDGRANGVIVNSGGALVIDAGGVGLQSVIGKGGTEFVASGGFASGDIISNGGLLDLDGAAGDGTVLSGGTLVFGGVVRSGQTLDYQGARVTVETALGGVLLSSGALLRIESAVVQRGATLRVGSGGVVQRVAVQAGGVELLGSGAREVGGSVSAGGLLYGEGTLTSEVAVAGTISGLTAIGSAAIEIQSGGKSEALTVELGAVESVMSGAVASGVIVGARGAEVIAEGATGSGTIVLNHGSEAVEGVARGTIVSSGGDLGVTGTAYDARIGVGGIVNLTFSGVASGGVVAGKETVTNEAAVFNQVVASGGLVFVDQVGSAFSLVVSSGGALQLAAFQGVTIGDVVRAGGELIWGGQISGLLVDGASVATATALGGVTLDAGAILRMSGAQVLPGATLSLGAGAPAASLLISSGGLLIGPGPVDQVLASGGVSGVSVIGGGNLRIGLNGSASNVLVRSGGVIQILDDGTGNGDIVQGGATEYLMLGGVAEGETIQSGGLLVFNGDAFGGEHLFAPRSVTTPTVLSGVTLSSGARLRLGTVTVWSGGALTLEAGAPAAGYLLVNAGGVLTGAGAALKVDDDGVVSGITIASGGVLTVSSGAVAGGDTIASGGDEYISSGAIMHGGTIRSGGTLTLEADILSGQTVTAATSLATTRQMAGVTVSAGATVNLVHATVERGATLSVAADAKDNFGATVSAGGVLVGPGRVGGIDDLGLVSGARIGVAGEWVIESGGVGRRNVIDLGLCEVASGGTVTADVVEAVGGLVLSKGAVARAETISSGGQMFVAGVASTTVVSSGGRLLISSGGTGSGTRIGSGGAEIVSSGAVEVAATVGPGGVLTVSRGGSISGGLAISGGKAVIRGTVASGQTVVFGSAGVLELDNASGFHAQISGFGGASDHLGLGGFVFSSTETLAWTQSGTSGTLTVTDGSLKAVLTLVGSYSVGDFSLATDGHGGTFVTDGPPPALDIGPPPTGFVQAMAGMPGGRSMAAAPTHAGTDALRNPSALVAEATSGR